MQHIAHPIRVAAGTRPSKSIVVAALVALGAAVALVLVSAIDGDRPVDRAVPASVSNTNGSRAFALRPSESNVAAAISRRPSAPATRPDESTVAAAVSHRSPAPTSRPDESKVAAAISIRRTAPFGSLASSPLQSLSLSRAKIRGGR